jgi:FdhD protein
VLRNSLPLADSTPVDVTVFPRLPHLLRQSQAAFSATGGLHAAALFDGSGDMLVIREDVGRHNAVDKVIGWAAGDRRLPLAGHILMVSGRVSYEIVQKALAARIPVIAAVSAPSSLAIDLARSASMTLVGFLRGSTMNVYGDTTRVR